MKELTDRIQELEKIRDDAHEEIAELQRQLVAFEAVKGTPAEGTVRDILREQRRERRERREEREATEQEKRT